MVYCMYRLCAHIGFRVHEWDIRLGDLSGYLYVLHICNNLYPTFVLLSKPAILLDWVHIFVPARTRNSFFWACHVLIWAIVIIYSAKIILDNLICSPIQMLWDPFADGKCFSRLTCSPLEATWNGGKDRSCWDPRWVFLISSSSINATANLFILVLPQRVIWKLNIPKKNKIGISIVFASGILVIFASAFRVSSAAKLSSPDTTYFAADLLLCSLAEMTLSIFVVCAPVASRMWKHLRSLYKTLIMRRWVRTRSDPTTDQSDLPWASIPGVLSKGPDYRKIDHNAATAEKVSPSWPINNSRGIMCTNEIRSTVQDRSDSMVADQFGRIHPWVVEG
ncbi:hypothetical protein GGR52DRAFT_557748 [Hypoxylon sp. FL1284]|nr:hypothetical protein GGR52DRAFT_557748 [Hypoxylon sp. FL1284]